MDTSISILIVDDHEIVVDACETLLKQHGFENILLATDCEHGLDLAQEEKPDLIIIDISMPGLGGLGVIRRVRKENQKIKIIVFSMYDDPVIVTRALNSNIQGYISKTNSPTIIIEAVKTVFSGKTYLSHDVAQKMVLDKINAPESTLDILSDKEFEIFEMLVNGYEIPDIAITLQLSSKSVSNYITKIKSKLEVKTIVDLVHLGYQFNITKNIPESNDT